MIPPSALSRVQRLGLLLLLLTIPACGLSEYEGLMQKAQERADRFRDEQKYLDAPVVIPTEKDKEGHDIPLADVFFRPPKGIESKAKSQPRSYPMWQYSSRPNTTDFVFVEMAFDEGDAEFAKKVVASYPWNESVPPPERKPPWPFDSGEYNDSRSQSGYSIHIYKGGTKKIAVVYCFRQDKRDALRKVIDLSLQSLSFSVSAARQRYNQKTPWKLEK